VLIIFTLVRFLILLTVFELLSKTCNFTIHHNVCSIFSNSSHVDWCTASPDTILKLDTIVMIQTKFGSNTVVSNHFHSVKILLFSSARSRDLDGLIGIELPVSIYTTKTPIDLCRFNVRSST
jgi:hypothetical protein